MAFPGDDLLQKDARLVAAQARQKKLQDDLDVVKKGFELNYITEDYYRMVTGVFAKSEQWQGLRQRDIGKHNIAAYERVVHAAAQNVRGQLDAFKRYGSSEEPGGSSFGRNLDILGKGAGSVFGPVMGMATRGIAEATEFLMRANPVLAGQNVGGRRAFGDSSPEELGLAARRLFSDPVAAFTLTPLGQALSAGGLLDAQHFQDRAINFGAGVDLTQEAFNELPPSAKEEMLLAARTQEGFGATGQVAYGVGMLAATAASFVLAPQGLFGAKLAARGLTPGRAGAAVVGGSVGLGAIEFSTGAITNLAHGLGYGEEPEGDAFMDRLTRAAGVSGTAALVGSMLVGRPVAQAGRSLALAQESTGFAAKGLGMARFKHHVGSALVYSPNLTVGRMLSTGLVGAGIATSEAYSQGLPADEAIYAGVMGAGEWMGYDFMFTRLGGISKMSDALTRYSVNSHRNMAALGFLPERIKAMRGINSNQEALGRFATQALSAGQTLSSIAMTTAVVGSLGAGTALLSDEDPTLFLKRGLQGGALLGATLAVKRGLGQKFFNAGSPIPASIRKNDAFVAMTAQEQAMERLRWAGRLRSALPRETFVKLYGPNPAASLTREEAASMASIIAHDSWASALMDDAINPVHEIVGRRAMGMKLDPNALSHEEQALHTQHNQLIRQIVRFENEGRQIYDPEQLTALTKYAQVRTRLSQIFRDHGVDAPKEPRILVDGQRVGVDEALEIGYVQSSEAQARYFSKAHLGLEAKQAALAGETKGANLLPATAKTAGSRAPVPQTVAPQWAKNTATTRKAVADIEDLLQDPLADIGTARKVLGALGGTLTQKAGKEGAKNAGFWHANIPGMGPVSAKAVRTVLEQVRQKLKDIPPMFDGTGGAAAIVAPGLMLYRDPDTREESVGIIPSTAGLAVLGALGMVLTHGRGVKVAGFARELRRVGAEASKKYGREFLVGVADTGDAYLRMGGKDSVTIGDFVEKGVRFVFLPHNHPPLPGGAGGKNIRDILPSAADIYATLMSAPLGQAHNVLGAVLSPGSEMLTLFRPKAAGMLSTFIRKYSGPFLQKAHAISRREAVKTLEHRYASSLRRTLVEAGAPPHLFDVKGGGIDIDVLYGMAQGFVGAEGIIKNLIEDVFEPAGIEILLNVTDDLFESILARHLNKMKVPLDPGLVSRLASLELKNTAHRPSPGMDATSRLVRDPKLRKRAAEILLDQPEGRLESTSRVAPAGSGRVRRPLPASITAQEISQAPVTLSAMNVWAKTKGLQFAVENVGGVRKFVFRNAEGIELAADTSITKATRNLREAADASERGTNLGASPSAISGAPKNETPAQRTSRLAQAGRLADPGRTNNLHESKISQAFGAAGGIVGAAGGGIISSLLDPDEESNAGGAIVGGVFGYLVAGALAKKGAGLRGTSQTDKLIRLVMPEVKLLTAAESKAKLGKPGLTSEEFAQFPGPYHQKQAAPGKPVVDYQTQHLVQRLTFWANSANKSLKEKQAAIQADLMKFTPNVASEESLNTVEAALKQAAIAADFKPHEAARLWRGYLNQVAVGAPVKQNTKYLNYKNLDLAPVGPVSSLEYMDDLKAILVNAEIASGPNTAEIESATAVLRKARKLAKDIIHPEAKELAKFVELVDQDYLQKAPEIIAGAQGMLLSHIFPTRHFRSIGEKLVSQGQVKDGEYVVRVYDTIDKATRLISDEFEKTGLRIRGFFQDMTLQERKWVRFVLEGDAEKTAAQWREQLKGNTRVLESAQAFDTELRRLAKFAGMEEKMLMEEYFAYFYSQRTMRELKATGLLVDESLTVPGYSNIPRVKFFRAAMPRQFDGPLGPVIEDPIEVGMIYAYGAIRKHYLDKMLATVQPDTLKNLSTRQPFIAKALGQWITDIHGIPRSGTLQTRATLDNLGAAMEARFPGLSHSWGRAIMDKYYDKIDPRAISMKIRAFEFLSKLSFMVTSPMVNLTQLLNDGGVEIGVHNLFMGTIYSGAGKLVEAKRPELAGALAGGAIGGAAGALADDDSLRGGLVGAGLGIGLGGAAGRAARKSRALPDLNLEDIAFTSPWLNPFAAGKVVRRMAMDRGLLSPAFRKDLDQAVKGYEAWNSARLNKPGQTVVAGAVGAVAGGFIGTEIDEDFSTASAIIGATAGVGMQTRLLKLSGQRVKHAATWMFNIAEATNRGVVAGGSFAETRGALRAERLVREGKLTQGQMTSRLRLQDTAESTAVGIVAGAGVGLTRTEDDENKAENALIGGLVGGALGFGLGRLAEPRKLKLLRDIDLYKRVSRPVVSRLEAQLIEEGPITNKEVVEFMMQQHVIMTQFNFGRASRGTILRTPLGESIFALQTYMLNQAEFLSTRLSAFSESTMTPGKMDLRFFRHVMLLGATGSALTALYGFGGDERGFDYWASRIGFGLMPFVVWNESAQKWNMANMGAAFSGPFASDVFRAAQVYFKLATDPVARSEWTQNIDQVFSQIVPALRQTRNTPEALGELFNSLGLEGLKELSELNGIHEAAAGLGSPISTLTGREQFTGGQRGRPQPSRSRQQEQKRRQSGFGGLGNN